VAVNATTSSKNIDMYLLY